MKTMAVTKIWTLIMKCIGQVAYQLDLPQESKIHSVFHVSLLKKALALAVTPQPLPIMLSKDLELQVEPAAILAARNHSSSIAEVLIQWKDLPAFEPTWESADVINDQFPDFHLEDKVKQLGGSIVSNMPPITRTYFKKKPRNIVRLGAEDM